MAQLSSRIYCLAIMPNCHYYDGASFNKRGGGERMKKTKITENYRPGDAIVMLLI